MQASHAAEGHGVKSPEWQYNMSVRPSLHPSSRPQEFCDFVFVLISSIGVQCRDAFIPSGVQISLYVSLYIYLSCCPHRFLATNRAACNYAQIRSMQVTGSNPLSSSIIRPSVHLYDNSRAFLDFCIIIIFQCGGPASRHVYPHTRVQSSLYIHTSIRT